jgi:hypothetical protein
LGINERPKEAVHKRLFPGQILQETYYIKLQNLALMEKVLVLRGPKHYLFVLWQNLLSEIHFHGALKAHSATLAYKWPKTVH